MALRCAREEKDVRNNWEVGMRKGEKGIGSRNGELRVGPVTVPAARQRVCMLSAFDGYGDPPC